jgi:hypothetical protein
MHLTFLWHAGVGLNQGGMWLQHGSMSTNAHNPQWPNLEPGWESVPHHLGQRLLWYTLLHFSMVLFVVGLTQEFNGQESISTTLGRNHGITTAPWPLSLLASRSICARGS